MKSKRTQSVFYPTYECYRELTARATDGELTHMTAHYSGCYNKARGTDNPTVTRCFYEALRACEDEQLARDYEKGQLPYGTTD